MNKPKQLLRSLFFSTIACVIAVSISIFSQPVQSQETAVFTTAQSFEVASEALHQAESALIAQGMMESSPLTRYVAVLTKDEVMPMASSSSAFGAAGAVLVGDRLIVRGDFSNLSSPLRDYATDPLNPPNPNITSGVHIHRGEPNANGPFQYALQVSPSESGLQGRLMGEYTLTPEQLQALANGKMYVDIHTKQNRGGELRGIFKPY
ncbi:CHRD domain-containing protein [Leptolyngbya sp. FACHB-17]|uniref:CHRD domain-containing protein n=1 Tax=unclassified Leptolyngbya TaxID=2650499 RepID=UPI0016807A43|nr:CHRD domain-containing protein [Leptolyngbya sp. FACHB-17]MBD2078985.1 CHRD domain-containing protein [Leptolyngbya sp. FACHB-17]